MINITIEDVLVLVNALKQKGILPLGSGDIINDNDKNDELTLKIYSYDINLYYFYRFFNKYQPISIEENFFDKVFNDSNRDKLIFLALYYVGYTQAYGKEPFNLVKEFYDYLTVGGEYRYATCCYKILSSKVLSNDNELQVTYSYIDSETGLISTSSALSPITKTFNFNAYNPKVFRVIKDFAYDFSVFCQRNNKYFDMKHLLKRRKKIINALMKECRNSLKYLKEIEKQQEDKV